MKLSSWNRLVAIWGVVGVFLIIGQALLRLTPIAWEPIADGSLTPTQAGIYGFWVVFNAYAEGYRGFQLAFCPRVVSRALWLSQNPRPLFVLLAPLFCMSFFHTTRRQKIVTWCLLIGILVLVLSVSRAPQPWRGIVDGGVVVGLGWGLCSLGITFVRALIRGDLEADPALPEEAPN
ncbi:hypothetical protein MK489_10970 [Myxococcota bacterium]|nr:hypothetical protein [Myxococcota bacterium]